MHNKNSSALLLTVLLVLILPVIVQGGTVYFSFGLHTDFYHSYRGDTPDDDGFGHDIDAITATLDILEVHPEVKLSWEFDSWQTLEQRLPEYAPELFERIKARVEEKDEVRFQSWNGGIVTAETPEEFAAGINMQRETLMSIFGKAENGVYPQEMMHSPSLIPAYNDLGIEWVSLFYSASPFTAFRRYAELEGADLYNPLWLETPDGQHRMIVLPTYHHADVTDFMGFAPWAQYVHMTIEEDVLIFVAFDADSISWELVFDMFLSDLEELTFVEFCTPGEYLMTHEPESTIVLRRDLADGAFDGYHSWAEKPINHEIWTAIDFSRSGENDAEFLTNRFSLELPAVEDILEQNFLTRLITLKTTHFGLANPFLHPDRVEKARFYAGEIRRLSSEAKTLTETAVQPHLAELFGEPPAMDFPGTLTPCYIYRDSLSEESALTKIPLEYTQGESYPGGIRVFQNGQEIPGGLINVEHYEDGSVKKATLVFVCIFEDDHDDVLCWISRSEDPDVEIPDYGLIDTQPDELNNGLITLSFDESGFPVSFIFDGIEFAGDPFICPGIVYAEQHFGPAVLVTVDEPFSTYGRGFLHEIKRWGFYDIDCESESITSEVQYRFRIYAGIPALEIETKAEFPELEEPCLEKFTEAVPLGIKPEISGANLRVWKHNFFDDVSYYDIDDPIDTTNSHITASWCAISAENKGLCLAYDAVKRASHAFCPLKIIRNDQQKLTPVMNPFGTFWGELPSYDARRTGGSGMGETFTLSVTPHLSSAAPAYSGHMVESAVLALPYCGDEPAEATKNTAELYSTSPSFILTDELPYISPQLQINMPADFFVPGDIFDCRITFENENIPRRNVPLVLLLDIQGQYWFWDDWTQEFDFESIDIPPGESEKIIFNPMEWPQTGNQKMDNLTFHAALLNNAMTAVLSNIDSFTFGFGPARQ